MSWWGYAAGGTAVASGIAVAVWRGGLRRLDRWLRRPAPSAPPAERAAVERYEPHSLGESPDTDG